MWVLSEKTDSDSKTESIFKVKEWIKLLWVWTQDLQFVGENYLFVINLKPADFFPTTESLIFLSCLFPGCETAQKTLIFLSRSNNKKIQEKKKYFHQTWNWSRKKKKVFSRETKHFFFQKKKKIEKMFFVEK